MMMDEVLSVTGALLAGFALGALFFGGLFWTLRRGLSAGHPELWVFASLLLRVFIVLAGFYAVGHDDWHRLLASLAGFVVARIVATHFARRGKPLQRQSEAPHASES
jgi:F1F0 ATPase subunit 2